MIWLEAKNIIIAMKIKTKNTTRNVFSKTRVIVTLVEPGSGTSSVSKTRVHGWLQVLVAAV